MYGLWLLIQSAEWQFCDNLKAKKGPPKTISNVFKYCSPRVNAFSHLYFMPSQNEKSLRNESKEFYGLLVLSNGESRLLILVN